MRNINPQPAGHKPRMRGWQLIVSGVLMLGVVQTSYAANNTLNSNHTLSANSKAKSAKALKPKKRSKHRVKAHTKDYMRGTASYYGDKFSCRRMANGKLLEMSEFTAAHPVLPLGSKVKVTNLRNGRSIYVEITDRMPKRSGHVIDLTPYGAETLGFKKQGLTKVKLVRVSQQVFVANLPAELESSSATLAAD